jgi:hypothetical protein
MKRAYNKAKVKTVKVVRPGGQTERKTHRVPLGLITFLIALTFTLTILVGLAWKAYHDNREIVGTVVAMLTPDPPTPTATTPPTPTPIPTATPIPVTVVATPTCGVALGDVWMYADPERTERLSAGLLNGRRVEILSRTDDALKVQWTEGEAVLVGWVTAKWVKELTFLQR